MPLTRPLCYSLLQSLRGVLQLTSVRNRKGLALTLESPSTLTAVQVGLRDFEARVRDLIGAPQFRPPLCVLQTKMLVTA